MKKLALFLSFATATICFSQPIAVSTTTYNNSQLINTLLLNNSCTQGTNINAFTGSNSGSVNGIGSFTNTNPNFPMTSGLVLSTGNVSNSVGPNTTLLSTGSTGWGGDTDLQNILAPAGVAVTTANASFLEFNFTAETANFGFDYLFASDEYGNFQCDFFDSFAFILSDLTAGTPGVNLAVIPGTNIPVSVQTIRDNAWNSACPSANPSYFGVFNGGGSSLTSPTNYNGQTVLMNASAVLIPGHTYHIKLVIADNTDFENDSAVFISASSFNLGQDVFTTDLTISANKAVCFGETKKLDTGLSTATYTFSWTKDGVAFPSPNGSYIDITDPGKYEVSYSKIGVPCPPTVNDILVEYLPVMTTPDPIKIERCNIPGQVNYLFNLTYNTPIVLGTMPVATTDIKYYNSLSDANTNTAPITAPILDDGTGVKYVKITDTLTGCSVIKPFDLDISLTPVTAVQPLPYSTCEDVKDSKKAIIIFSGFNPQVLGAQDPLTTSVSYHLSQANANAGTNPLNTTSYPQSTTTYGAVASTIFVRVQNRTDPACFETKSFTITITKKPKADELERVVVCDQYILLPLSTPTQQYWTQVDGPAGTGTQLFAGDIVNYFTTGPVKNSTQIIHVFEQIGLCTDDKPFTVQIVDFDKILEDTTACDSFALPDPDYATYWTGPNKTGVQLLGGTKITPSFPNAAQATNNPPVQDVYIHYETLEPIPLLPFPNDQKCQRDQIRKISLYKTPILTGFKDLFLCAGSTYKLEDPNIAYNILNPANAALPVGDVSKVTLEYRTAASGGALIPNNTLISTPNNNFVYLIASNGSTPPCAVTQRIVITIGITVPATGLQVCEKYKLPGVANIGYFNGPNATGGNIANASEIIFDGINTTKTIYMYAVGNAPDATTGLTCPSEEKSFVINFNKPIVADRTPVELCANYTLPALSSGETYNTNIDGTGTTIVPGILRTNSETLYVFKASATDPTCYTSKPLVITINKAPVINVVPNQTKCQPFLISSLLLPTDTYSYYENPGGVGLIPTTKLIKVNTTIYAYEKNPITGCVTDTPVIFEVFNTIAKKIANITECDSFTLGSTPATILDIPVAAADYNKFYSATGGVAGTEIAANAVIITSQRIYVYYSKLIRSGLTCSDETFFDVTINKTPVITAIPDVKTCDSYVLPPLQVFAPALNTTIEYSSDPDPITGLITKFLPGEIITKSQKIHINAFSENPSVLGIPQKKCQAIEKTFDILINKVDALTNVVKCGSYQLPTQNAPVGTTPATNIEGDYYTESGGPSATSILIPKGSLITPTFPIVTGAPSTTTLRRFYIYEKYASTEDVSKFCSSETFFDVTIISPPIANPLDPADRTFCDTDATNDGILSINLSLFDAKILNPSVPPVNYVTQAGPEFSVTYYANAADANAKPPVNPITSTLLKNVYVRVNNSLAPDCFDVKPIDIIINRLPETDPKKGVICFDNKTGLAIAPYVIDTGLNNTDYTFEWKNSSNVVVGTSSSNTLPVALPDTYTVVATDVDPKKLCKSVIKSATVIQSTKAIAGFTLSENFSDNQYVTVIADGIGGIIGDYVYQLDDDAEQDSNVFYNVEYGAHKVTIRDKNGCGITVIDVLVINYPKYFTPNGDGIHDNWNVIGLKSQQDSNVLIYDRFGKLIKQIASSGPGWDGFYNGQLLPSTDYWFAVNYVEKGEQKIFKSHFSLKR